MKNKLKILLSVILGGGLYYGFTMVQPESKSDDMPDLKSWPEASQKAAKETMDKYGKPSQTTADMLIWNNNGPWVKTIIYKTEMKHNFPRPHTDVMEQWVHLRVPADKFDELAHYDGSVTANRTNGTISARCDKESMNYLALNLSYDIINGNKSVEQARTEYGKTVMAFMKGEKMAITQKLNFSSDKSAPDPDKPLDSDMKVGMDGSSER